MIAKTWKLDLDDSLVGFDGLNFDTKDFFKKIQTIHGLKPNFRHLLSFAKSLGDANEMLDALKIDKKKQVEIMCQRIIEPWYN